MDTLNLQRAAVLGGVRLKQLQHVVGSVVLSRDKSLRDSRHKWRQKWHIIMQSSGTAVSCDTTVYDTWYHVRYQYTTSRKVPTGKAGKTLLRALVVASYRRTERPQNSPNAAPLVQGVDSTIIVVADARGEETYGGATAHVGRSTIMTRSWETGRGRRETAPAVTTPIYTSMPCAGMCIHRLRAPLLLCFACYNLRQCGSTARSGAWQIAHVLERLCSALENTYV